MCCLTIQRNKYTQHSKNGHVLRNLLAVRERVHVVTSVKAHMHVKASTALKVCACTFKVDVHTF